MPNNIFSKNLINVSFSTKFYGFFLWRLQCTKKLRNSPLCPREWSSITYGSFLRFFLFSLPFRNSTMPNNRFLKNSIIWVFQRNFMFFSWRLQCTKKLRNSPLYPREWRSITNGSFLRFFLFSLPLRNSIMPNNMFFKKLNNLSFSTKFYVIFCEDCNVRKNCEILHFIHGSEAQSQMEVFFDFFSFHYHLGTVSCQITDFKKLNNLSFSTKFYVFFCEDCNVPKNCEILHFVHGSEAQSQMEVFFDFFSFHYHLGTVSCQIIDLKKLNNLSFSTKFHVFFVKIAITKKLRNSPLCPREWSWITNRSFLRFFLFSLPFRNSIMPNNSFSKNSIIWVFQRNFMLLFEDCNYEKIAKFSTLSTGVKLNHKWKFSSIFSLFITI